MDHHLASMQRPVLLLPLTKQRQTLLRLLLLPLLHQVLLAAMPPVALADINPLPCSWVSMCHAGAALPEYCPPAAAPGLHRQLGGLAVARPAVLIAVLVGVTP